MSLVSSPDAPVSVTATAAAAALAGADAGMGGPSADRTRQIVLASYELLDQEGLEGLTIRAVLKKTGLSRRAFYERFGGKDDLVLAVFEQTIRFAAQHYGAQAMSADPVQRLERIVMGIVLGRDAPGGADGDGRGSDSLGAAMSREHLRLAEARPADLQAALSPLIQLIARILADGMAAGQVRACDPERLATLVYNLVATTVHTELLARENRQPDPVQRLQLATEIWDFCRRAVAA